MIKKYIYIVLLLFACQNILVASVMTNFTQLPPVTDYNIDCAVDGPLTIDYCYVDDDTNVFNFNGSLGSRLKLTVNSGGVENNWDEFIVFDSNGITNLSSKQPYGNNGDLSGFTYVSTGNKISFRVQSDDSINCNSSAAIETLNITVSCITCDNPDIKFLVIDDCASGSQFLVDVDVSSLGDATTLEVKDNLGNAPLIISATGVHQLGPYPFGVDVSFSAVNQQDSNCFVNSALIRLDGCPPVNDKCINATEVDVNTGSECTVFAEGTLVNATPSGVATGSCAVVPTNDIWFKFTALTSTQLITIGNGAIANIDFAVYEGDCNNLVELACFPASVGSLSNLTIGKTYFIRVFTSGDIPNNLTFKVCVTRPPPGISCSQSGTFCSSGGVQTAPNVINFPSLGSVACLGTTPNPVWNTITIGISGDLEIQISQKSNSGAGLDADFVLWGPFKSSDDFCAADVLDSGCPNTANCPSNRNQPDFYPYGNIVDCSYSSKSIETMTIKDAKEGQVYILLVTNFSNNPGNIEINQTNANEVGAGAVVSELLANLSSDTGDSFVDDDSNPATPPVLTVCGPEQAILSVNSLRADTFKWYKDGVLLPGELTSNLTVTEPGTYKTIINDLDCIDQAEETVVVKLYKSVSTSSIPNMELCDDTSGDGVEDFDLESHTSVILGAQTSSDFKVTYHTSLVNAEAGLNPLTSPHNASTNTDIYVRVEDVNAIGSNSGCVATGQFKLLIPGRTPEIFKTVLKACDDDTDDGIEQFNLNAEIANILGTQSATDYDVSFYKTEVDAASGVNPLGAMYTNTVNTEETIYVKVEDAMAKSCYVVQPFVLEVVATPRTNFSKDQKYSICPNASEPLVIVGTPENYDPSIANIKWYFEGDVIPNETGLTMSSILTHGNYTLEVDLKGCITTTDIEITERKNCEFPQGISPNGDGKNDDFNLGSFDVKTIKVYNRNGTEVFSKVDGYTNEWHGQSKSGELLPVGTYYYVVEYGKDKVKASWVYINK